MNFVGNFLMKCPNCGSASRSRECSDCGRALSAAYAVCAGCGQSIEDCDVKECKGLLVHDRQSCWSKRWNSC
jgi:hypothetical protein